MNHHTATDFVGDGIAASNAAWSFGGDTPKQFDDHVTRSVPRYDDGHELVVDLSDFFVKPDSICYEIGCSTGTLTRRLAQHHRNTVRWVGLDLEPTMIDHANLLLKERAPEVSNIQFVTDDAHTHPFENSDFIVAYYTVQFVPPRFRQDLLRRIYQTLNWGGAFLLFEKVRGPDARFQDLVTTLYTDFKLRQGYTAHQIVQKTRSLKGVLEPFSTKGNLDLLRRAGFVDVMTIFKHICFEGFLCIK
jgi:tRNA (cmo5U34)-methyltransferase